MTCPYEYTELKELINTEVAQALTAYEKMFGIGTSTDVIKSFKAPATRRELNERAAHYNAVHLDQFVMSPAFEELREEYSDYLVNQFLDFLKDKFDLSDKGAWALVFFSGIKM